MELILKNTIMVSGHTDITEELFLSYYVPKLDNALNSGSTSFVVGTAGGTDSFFKEWVKMKSINHPKYSIKVYVVSVNPVYYEYEKGENTFMYISNFNSNKERDGWMTKYSCDDIAFLYDDNMAKGSGTCANLIRRHYGDKIATQVLRSMRAIKQDDDWKSKLKGSKSMNKLLSPSQIDNIISLILSHTMIGQRRI